MGAWCPVISSQLLPSPAWTGLDPRGRVLPLPRAGLGPQLTQPGCSLHMEGWKTTCTQQDSNASGVFPSLFLFQPEGVAEALLPAEQDKYLELGLGGTSVGDSVM